MPSTYNQVIGYDANGEPVQLGDNNRRTKPTTKMGTRQIVKLVVYTDADIVENFQGPNSLYSQIVRALQQQVELYAVYTPGESFFDCYGDFAFCVDIAWDTANALWNSNPGNVVTDNHPMEDWEFVEQDLPNITDGNNFTLILLELVADALDAAGVNTNCWVTTNYTTGDVAWPIDTGGGAPPQLMARVGENGPNTQYALRPGMSREERAQQIAAWKATVFKG